VHGAGIRITGIEKKRSARLSVFAPGDVPEIRANDDLAGVVLASLARDDEPLQDGDILILAQKIVSKAEGRSVALSTVRPSKRALELAEVTRKDARLIELILGESSEVLRQRDELIVVQHRLVPTVGPSTLDQNR
jgi:coenzyme F420-0:L-glutamate ligase/coenzyme F420-1:gamma-L-glutamate ligase